MKTQSTASTISLPKTYQALILESIGVIRVAELPLPSLAPGDLLVQVKAATTCGTDLKAYRRGHPQIPMPGGFGHEYAGIVATTGAGAKFHVGDPIMGVHTAPCQSCRWCKKGQENLCETIMDTKVLGSFAEYLRIPARIANLNVFLKPDTISYAQAALLEPLACVTQGLQEVNFDTVRNALVIGPGAIGLMFAKMLQTRGIETILLGRSPARLDVARQMELTTAQFSNPPQKSSFDLVVECTGTKEIWEMSPQWSAKGGQIVLFGGLPSGTEVSFDSGKLHYDQITLLSPFHFGSDAVKIAYDALKTLDLSPLISGKRKICDAKAVFDDLASGKGVKYVLTS